MVRKTSKFLFPVLAVCAAALAIACGVFLHRGQQRLLDLLTHTSQKPTEVYSQWLELVPDPALTADYILATLQVLGYENVKGPLGKPGDYHKEETSLSIWTRGFDYPDRSLPSQAIRLTFASGRLDSVETLPDNRRVPSWRLEPKRLARWATHAGAAQPQVRIADLPAYVPQSIIAIEDKRFFQHGAIDVHGLLRAVWVDLREGQLRQGGSTISQQLSRSIFLDVRRTVTRKLLEAGLAFYLEARYSKTQLLEMYLNQVYWGQEGAESLLGLESASRSFFGKPARDLKLSESALLAGLLQSPNHYSPRADPRVARQRRNLVLALMANQGLITGDQLTSALKEPVDLAPLIRAGEAPYFISTLQESLGQQYSLGLVMNQGWRIFTTLDPVLQSHAVAAVHPVSGQAALVAIDPRSGAVRAWVGGTDYGTSTFDRVVYAKRQPGSAFKPFVMLAAIDSRQATQVTLLDDKRFTVKTPQGPWSPQNYDRKYRGKVSLWDALVYSINVPTVHLAMQTGLARVVDYAHRMGIQSALREVPSLALGTSEVTVLELTSAYATLANAGRFSVPYSIETILDSENQPVMTHSVQAQEAVPAASAWLVTEMLQAVFDEGTAKQARQGGFTYATAGKTGTSENYQDAWFIGYTSRLVCGVWVGYDQPKSLGRASAGIALPIWAAFMQKALAYWPPETPAEPKELVWKTVDVESGDLARSGCPHRRKHAFLPGTAPEKLCTLHPGGIWGFFYRLKK